MTDEQLKKLHPKWKKEILELEQSGCLEDGKKLGRRQIVILAYYGNEHRKSISISICEGDCDFPREAFPKEVWNQYWDYIDMAEATIRKFVQETAYLTKAQYDKIKKPFEGPDEKFTDEGLDRAGEESDRIFLELLGTTQVEMDRQDN